MSLHLTDRWFPIPNHVRNHAVQMQLLDDLVNKRYYEYVVAAGRRSFKTERFLKRYGVLESIHNINHCNFLGAPVRTQAKEIFWKDVKALSPKHLIRSINETELKIEYVSKSTLKVVGLKEFATVEGGYANFFGITEYQKCNPDVYTHSIEPMVNDVGGITIKEGRPLERNHLFTDYLKGIEHKPGHASYHWTSEEILTALQIERAKDSLGTIDYNREYLASFDTGGNPPYYAFNTTLNASQYQLQTNLPLIIACDFNATEKPMSWVIGQRLTEYGQDVTHWTKCFSYTFTNTETMCDIVAEYLKDLYFPAILFYGDYAGKQQKSNSSYSDWDIIESKFRNRKGFEKRLKPCKSIRDSIASTNSRLCNTQGLRRQFVNVNECTALVKDWELCKWKDNSKELEEKDAMRGHACRAVDYYNDYEYPVKGVSKTEVRRNFDN